MHFVGLLGAIIRESYTFHSIFNAQLKDPYVEELPLVSSPHVSKRRYVNSRSKIGA